MYPGQYQNFGAPQIPGQRQAPPQAAQAVQHVLVPQGWTPQGNQNFAYTSTYQPHPIPTNAYLVPSNPFAVQGISYSTPAPIAYTTTHPPPVQYVIHQAPVAAPGGGGGDPHRLLELRRTASDGPGPFAHISNSPAYGLSNSVGSNYHQRYLRQFQNFQGQQQPIGGVYMVSQPQQQISPRPTLTASISPQPSHSAAPARPQRAVSPPPPPYSPSSASRPAPSSHTSSLSPGPPPPYSPSSALAPPSHSQRPASVSPVPSVVLDDAADPQPFLPQEESLREGWLNFSASNDRYSSYWMILYKDFFVCLDTNSRPLWKITLWGTSVESIPQFDGKRFAILSGYGQVFWFEAENALEASEWIRVLKTEVYQPASRSAAPGLHKPAAAAAASVASPSPSSLAAPAPSLSTSPSAKASSVPPPNAPSSLLASRRSTSSSGSGFFGFISGLFTDTNDEELRKLCLDASPDQTTRIRKQLEHNLSTSVHSLGRAVDKFQAAYRRSHEALGSSQQNDVDYEKLFAAAVAELLAFIREMSGQIVALYPFLAEIDNIEQVCHEAVELSLTPKLYPLLSAMYHRRYRAEDAAHSKKISEFLTVTPAHLGIRKLLWLLRSDTAGFARKADTLAADVDADDPPYYAAIRHLKLLPSMTSGHDKLNCLIETGKIICQCVKLFWEGQVDPMKLVVGADDLVPIFTYVMIKANVPHMHAEAAMVQDLMSEKAAMEVGGYSLATLQTCLQHLTMLERQEVMRAAEDAAAAQIDTQQQQRDSALSPASSSAAVAQQPSASPAVSVAPAPAAFPPPAPAPAPAPASVAVATSAASATTSDSQPAVTFSFENLAAALAPPEPFPPAPPSGRRSSVENEHTLSSGNEGNTAAPSGSDSITISAPTKLVPDLISFQ